MVIFSARICEISHRRYFISNIKLQCQTKKTSQTIRVTTYAWVRLQDLVADSADILLFCIVAEYVVKLFLYFFKTISL